MKHKYAALSISRSPEVGWLDGLTVGCRPECSKSSKESVNS